MLAKSYTKIYFGNNIRITSLFQNKNFYLSSERVLCPFRETRSRYRPWDNVESLLRLVLYKKQEIILTPSSNTGGFLCGSIFASLSFVAI